MREYVCFKSCQKQRTVSRCQSVALVGNPFPCNSLEGVFTGYLGGSFSRLLRCIWIDILRQQSSRFVSASTCSGKRHDRINAESERATLPSEPIVEPPVTCAIWRDEQIHAAAVAQFVCLGLRLGVANARIGQTHDGISASL